jgi:hypothetical protein
VQDGDVQGRIAILICGVWVGAVFKQQIHDGLRVDVLILVNCGMQRSSAFRIHCTYSSPMVE